MRFWNDYPLLRILFPMLAGILWAYFFPGIGLPYFYTLLLLVLLILWLWRPKFLRRFVFRSISGVILSILFFSLGMQLLKVKQEHRIENHYTKLDSISYLVIRINSPLIEKPKSYKTTGSVIAVYDSSDSLIRNAMGKILTYFEKSHAPPLEYGDEILILSHRLQEIKSMGNPHEFDYKAYLSRQNIFHQIYLTQKDWLITKNSSPQFLKKTSFQVRGVLLEVLRSFKFRDSEFAVASALLLGYDEYLDEDLQQLYSGSGAMHILCVSGLHVGIIFMIFNLLLGPLKKLKYGNHLVSILLILIIWFYAMVTGMSPSVFRSATMFSFITMGMAMRRKNSTYNSLMASAIVLLISDPCLIFHIGFQLSYMAVLAILFVQPLLSGLVDSKYLLLRKVRDLITVSIAAQLGTFPLAIYYFHQFPNYFILTNLIVIPLSFLILIAGFSNIAVVLIGLGSSFIGSVFQKVLYALLLSLNSAIDFISHLPFAVSSDLYFTFFDTCLVYLIILFLILAIKNKSKIQVYISMVFLILLLSYNILMRYSVNRQSQLTIYHMPKTSVIEIIDGQRSHIYLDSANRQSEIYKRYISGHQYNSRIRTQYLISIDSIGLLEESVLSNSLFFNEKSLFIIDNRILFPKKKLHFNYVLIRSNPRLSLYELQKHMDFDTLIWDASNKYWKIDDWVQECDSLHIPYYDIQKKGAFIIKGS